MTTGTDARPLVGKTAVVTGAGRGLGRAMAEALADAGARVAGIARDSEQLADFVSAVTSRGGHAIAATADIRDPESVATAISSINDQYDTVDILINNAGNNVKKPVVPLPSDDPNQVLGQPGSGPASVGFTMEEWDSILDTHVRGSLQLIHAFVPGMLERRSGRVINIGSSSVARMSNMTVAYAVGKGTMTALTRALANEWAEFGITVNAIAPGHFRTEMTKRLHDSEEGQEWLKKRIPMKRTGDATELGALAVHLATDAASFITGQVIYVDGGETL